MEIDELKTEFEKIENKDDWMCLAKYVHKLGEYKQQYPDDLKFSRNASKNIVKLLEQLIKIDAKVMQKFFYITGLINNPIKDDDKFNAAKEWYLNKRMEMLKNGRYVSI